MLKLNRDNGYYLLLQLSAKRKFLSEKQGEKVMKRVLSVLLAVCMLFAVVTASGCTLSTAKTIDDAIKKTEALDDVDVTFVMEVSMDMGFSITVPVTVNMKAKNIKSETPTVSADMVIPMMGMEFKTGIYQEQDMLYITADDMSYKMKIEESEGEYDFIGDINNVVNDIHEDLLENIELVSNDDGSKTATLYIDEARFKEVFKDLITDSAEDTVVDDDSIVDDEDSIVDDIVDNVIDNISIKDATVKITVKDGYVSVYEISYSMTVSSILGDTTTSVKASVTYNNPGEAVEITPPSDYKNFGDYSEDSLFDSWF